jgi:protein TonB
MIALTTEDLADLRRWVICGTVVLFAQGAIAAALVNWRGAVDQTQPAGAVVIDFAPEEVSAPQQVQSDAVPEKPVEKVEKEQEEKVEAKGEEQIEQKAEPKPPEEQPREAVAVTTPPPPDQTRVAALPAAPVQGQPMDARAMQAWMGRLSALLERNKRYPKEALSRREHGVAQVFFSLDRQGHVIDSRIVSSSGSSALDAEALAMLQRAQPFPVWPAGHSGLDRLDLTVPVRFVR